MCRRAAGYVWQRNALVWRRLMLPSLAFNFGEPLLYLLGLGFGLGRFVGDIGDLPYMTFLASGLIASSAMNTASFEGTFSVFTRMTQQNTYEAILATPLYVDDIVTGEILWCATKAAVSSSSILLVAFLLGAITEPAAVLCIPIFLLVGLCFAGPAITISATSPSYDFFNYYITLVLTPMFIFCGVFYPAASLPDVVQPLVQILPLTHAVALLRPIATGGPVTNVFLHLGVLGGYAIIGYYLAIIFVRRRMIT